MNRTTRREVLAASGAALASAVAGCGTSTAGSGGEEASGDGGLPETAAVSMMSIPKVQYEPSHVHVAVGGTVTWTLESGSHDTTAYHPETKPPCRMPRDAEPWASSTLSTVGNTFEWTFDQPGVYDYVDTEAVCTSHASIGTTGRVVVGWPDPEDQPALEPPQSELPDLVQSNIEKHNETTRDLLADGPE